MAPRTAVGVLVAAIVLVVVMTVGSLVAASFFEAAPQADNGAAVEDFETDTWNSLGDERGINYQVYDSTGYAIRLDGSGDSNFESTGDVTYTTGDNWTVSSWGAIDSGVSDERAMLSLNGRLVVTYDAASGNWVAWYYDDSTTASYELSAPAQSQPGTLENVQVRANGTHLQLYTGSTSSPANVTDLDGTSNADAPDAGNWDGRIDEVRTWDEALDSTNRSALRSDPTGALPGTNRTARIMFDEWWSNEQVLLFADGVEVERNNADLVSSGLAGTDQTEGTDYEWNTGGPEVYPYSTGDLADDPVLYATWDNSEATVDDFQQGFWDMIQLGATLLLVMMAAVVIGVVRKLQ